MHHGIIEGMEDAAHRLGLGSRRARLAAGRTQASVGERCGLSQSALSRMELGLGGRTALDTWESVAKALDLRLVVDLEPDSRAVPEVDPIDRLVLDLAEQGGWSTYSTLRGSIRLVRSARREAAVIRTWDVVGDVQAGIDELVGAIDSEAARRGSAWRVGGLVVIRASGPNRRRMTEAEAIVDEGLLDLRTTWISALRRLDVRMPRRLAHVWASGNATRLTPSRLPLIRPRRRLEG